MDLLAQKRMLFVLIFLGAASAWAGEGPYSFSAVDFFALKGQQEMWAEPGGYTPPAVVTALLNDPNERTARQYLQWVQERLKRIARAQKAVDELQSRSLGEARP